MKINLDESHLSKAIADFGGHYMRLDLIRLLVNTRRKELITHADQGNGLCTYNMQDHVGLSYQLVSRWLKGRRVRVRSKCLLGIDRACIGRNYLLMGLRHECGVVKLQIQTEQELQGTEESTRREYESFSL